MNPNCDLPPLRLRTAYTYKGLGIGAGAVVGMLVGGPVVTLFSVWVGWMIGNEYAMRAEEAYIEECRKLPPKEAVK